MSLTVYANCDAAERATLRTSLTFPEILHDPLVRLLMKADQVDPKALETELWDIAAQLPSQPAPSIRPRLWHCT